MQFTLYTDGALRRYKTFTLGAWGYVLFNNTACQVAAQVQDYAGVTNNQMETRAVSEALKLVPNNSTINLYTDSQYVINGFKNNFNLKSNKSFWQELKNIIQAKNLKVSYTHVYGHTGIKGNTAADLTMRKMLDKIVKAKKAKLAASVKQG